jgi:putative two-component system response regulator
MLINLKPDLEALQQKLIISGKVDSHTAHIKKCTIKLAKMAGVHSDWAEVMGDASTYHDIGKLAVSYDILTSVDRLTPIEYKEIIAHPALGYEIISGLLCSDESKHIKEWLGTLHIDYHTPITDDKPDLVFFHIARTICKGHHESWDGRGYPHQLSSIDIPLPARIVAIVDMFDALMTRRSYKPSLTPEMTLQVMMSEYGKKLDPILMDSFINHYHEFVEIHDNQ